MNFIKKIFNNKIDDSVHRQFVRFGKGIYKNRAIIKFQKGKEIKISSTFEYVSDFVELIAEISDAKFTGLILSKNGLKEFFASKNKETLETKKAGMYVNNINEIESKIIKELKDKTYYFLLDAKADGIEFKCKKKLPKPGKSEGKADDKFCVLKADLKYWSKIKENFFPDVPENAKKCIAKHSFDIKNIIAPEGEKDYEKIRVLSKRAGKLKRILEIDKKEEFRECEFEA
ncbi:MAG: hypothetical protein WC584_05500 [Candidatus Pacearchaeota archaeon]